MRANKIDTFSAREKTKLAQIADKRERKFVKDVKLQTQNSRIGKAIALGVSLLALAQPAAAVDPHFGKSTYALSSNFVFRLLGGSWKILFGCQFREMA